MERPVTTNLGAGESTFYNSNTAPYPWRAAVAAVISAPVSDWRAAGAVVWLFLKTDWSRATLQLDGIIRRMVTNGSGLRRGVAVPAGSMYLTLAGILSGAGNLKRERAGQTGRFLAAGRWAAGSHCHLLQPAINFAGGISALRGGGGIAYGGAGTIYTKTKFKIPGAVVCSTQQKQQTGNPPNTSFDFLLIYQHGCGQVQNKGRGEFAGPRQRRLFGHTKILTGTNTGVAGLRPGPSTAEKWFIRRTTSQADAGATMKLRRHRFSIRKSGTEDLA